MQRRFLYHIDIIYITRMNENPYLIFTSVQHQRRPKPFGMGGGGGAIKGGSHFVYVGAHQWSSQPYWYGGKDTRCIDQKNEVLSCFAHWTRGSMCYHNFHNLILLM